MCLCLFLLFARDNHQLSQQRSGNSFFVAAAEEVKKEKKKYLRVSYVNGLLKNFYFSASVITEGNYFILKADFWSLKIFPHCNFVTDRICAI